MVSSPSKPPLQDCAPRPRGRPRRAIRRAGILFAASLGAACASPWPLAERDSFVPGNPPVLPPHLAVAEASLGTGGASFAALAYLRIRGGDIQAHFGAESGLTIMDLEVHGAVVDVRVVSPLAGPQGTADLLGADLRRMYGDLSVFGLGTVLPPARDVLEDAPEGDAPGRVAFPLPDGSWIVLSRASLGEGTVPSRAVLLGPDRIPRAEVDYLDPDSDGVPREVRLRDLVDGHRVDLEIVEVRLSPAEAGEKFP